jgi:tripartite-type tricarboxylate transporter receptor subunit TctC
VRASPCAEAGAARQGLKPSAARLTKDGVDPVGNTPAEFGAQIARELVQWRELVQAANIKAE